MENDYIAKSSISIDVTATELWNALVNPEIIKQFMFGTEVNSSWAEGDPITWKGLWEGKQYEDKGVILKALPGSLLQYTHFSPLAGLPDLPENYHTMTFEITETKETTILELSQDNNSTEKGQKHSESMWEAMLVNLKKILEK